MFAVDACLQIFLLFESLDYTTWAKKLADSRSAYEALKDHYLKNLINPDDVSAEDPLSDNASVSHTSQGGIVRFFDISLTSY